MSSIKIKNIAIILASGSGERFGTKTPKQFIKLAGNPVIFYSLETLSKCALIDEIIIVTKKDYIDYVLELVSNHSFTKVQKVISGGNERHDSTLAAINAIDMLEANLIIHDAVRPFITESIITDCIYKLNYANAVDVVVDATDTIVKVSGDYIESIPDRRFLKRGQTPQAFKKSVLERAYNKFLKDKDRHATDDCGIVLKYLPSEKIITIKGSEFNFKITHQQDIYLADSLIKDGVFNRLESTSEKIHSYLKNKNVVIIGGSSGIGQALYAECKIHAENTFCLSRKTTGTDITNITTLENSLEEIHKKTNRIDIIINTAGYLLRKPLSIMTEQEILSSISINYTGVINLARTSFKYLKQSQGSLINFTSSSYTRGRANYSIYSSSKAAVVNFTQALSEEWQAHGIKINVINPERTDTPMRTKNFGNESKETLLTADEVAKFTLSAISFEHTGQIYSIKNDLV